jgi:hypothetical protein
MGAMAEAIVAYAQPLLDQTDGSLEQMNKAFALAQICYNLALVPKDIRDGEISRIRQDMEMNDEEFEGFRRGIVEPMIRRHEEMFPVLHQRVSARALPGRLEPQVSSPMAAPAEKPLDRYAPCPCGSGKKYKFCCGSKKR